MVLKHPLQIAARSASLTVRCARFRILATRAVGTLVAAVMQSTQRRAPCRLVTMIVRSASWGRSLTGSSRE
jgi:hypothetical protein